MGGAIEKTATSRGGTRSVSTGHSPLCDQVRRFVTCLGLASFHAALRRVPTSAAGGCAEARDALGRLTSPPLTAALIGVAAGEMRGVGFAEVSSSTPGSIGVAFA